MKVVFIHTDLRIYWPSRLKALSCFLTKKNISLDVVEIAGEGSPYAFANQKDKSDLSWTILFPLDKMENLKSWQIKKIVLKKLDDLNPDIVIAGAIAFPSGALSVRWARKNHKRVIIFDDARVEHVERNCFVNFVKQAIYNGVDAMFYPSNKWEQTGIRWNFSTSDLFYGLNVVDNSFWKQNILFNNKLPNNYYLCVGRQIPKKNFITVLRAYKEYVHNIENPYYLLLVGDGEEHENILKYIVYNGLEKNVILFPFVQQMDLLSIYRQAKALVISSLFGETWGLVINEAMASGLPIIASSGCGATTTLIKNGINGYVFSPFNCSDLTDRLVQFHHLTNEQKVEMSQSSLRIISEWSLDTFVKSLYRAIQYVSQKSEKRLSLKDNFFIQLWNGRYRPI